MISSQFTPANLKIGQASVKGFSIYELMIAVTVLTILIAIAIPALRTYQNERDFNQARTDILEIQGVIDKFYVINNRFPNSLNEVNLHTRRDPWGNSYYYTNIATGGGNGGGIRKDNKLQPVNSDYDLFSAGKDGETVANFGNSKSFDDIVRCNNGSYIGLAIDY
ncbi:MAG: prepilin-type N-terminal cleavage/methylation domain-containing protein [Gammaproteobacteria bacterium]|nr:prepilin-type N-terminal cleavage/methylation domain-containing protein [Gammaproteobacteria bacterium]